MSTKKGLFDDSDDEEFVPKDNAGAGAAATDAIPKEESEIKKVEEAKTAPETAKQIFDDDDGDEYVPQG